MPYGTEIIATVISYIFGCFATGYYLVRFRTGQDIRSLGSGNVGARNVARSLGVPGFAITFLGDFAKGAIAVGAALYFRLEPWGVMLVILAVVAGHIWPVQLGFQGGKGAATAFGAVLVFDYQLIVVLIVLVGLTLALLRKFTLSGLVVIILSPVVAAVMGHPLSNILGMSILVLLILIAHRTNIRDILRAAHHGTAEKETKQPDSG
ncbi:glycerol-3-phosphate acyltransferase [Chloroflexota bacterium]